MLQTRWGLVIVSWDALAGLSAAAVVALLGPSADSLRTLAVAGIGGGIALVAVLATILTLLGVLLDAEALAPLVERLGGRGEVVFPFWFHGYLAAVTVALSIVAAAGGPPVAGWVVPVAMGTLAWGAFGMVDLAREVLTLGYHRRRLESAADQARRRSA